MWETTRNNARGRKLLRALMRLVKLRFIQIRHGLSIRKKKKKKKNAYKPGMTNTLRIIEWQHMLERTSVANAAENALIEFIKREKKRKMPTYLGVRTP